MYGKTSGASARARSNDKTTKTSAKTSYRLELAGDALRWHDDAAQPPFTWDREPEASLWSRGAARAIGWLPVESQL